MCRHNATTALPLPSPHYPVPTVQSGLVHLQGEARTPLLLQPRCRSPSRHAMLALRVLLGPRLARTLCRSQRSVACRQSLPAPVLTLQTNNRYTASKHRQCRQTRCNPQYLAATSPVGVGAPGGVDMWRWRRGRAGWAAAVVLLLAVSGVEAPSVCPLLVGQWKDVHRGS